MTWRSANRPFALSPRSPTATASPAVTLGIGIITTVFTAFTLTRLIVAYWVRLRRPQRVPI